MTIINTSHDRTIQIGYEGEDRVTVLRFRYGADWLENGEGIFNIRVRRHGEHTAYNAQLVTDDSENHCLLMTVTNVELSVKGSGEMQVVYSGADFVKKSPIYSYNVSRAVDEAVDPPAQDVYTQIIESLSDLQMDVQGKADVQTVSALADEITDLNSDVQGLQTIVQGKADTQTVTALSDTVSGLQTAMQGKADVQTVTVLSGTVSSLSDTTQQYMEYTNSAITDLQDNKASKSYVDGELATKANVQTVTALSGTVTDLQANKADKTYVDTELAGKASTQTVSDLVDDVYDIYPTDTASGVIANFPDGANSVPVKSLTVAIEPVQDLHGYDSPWPAGGGVNKADLTGATAYSDGTYGMYVTVDGEEITLAGTWTNSSVTGVWRFLRVPNIPSDLNVVAFESTSGNHVNNIRQDKTNNRLIITATNMVNGQAYTIKFKIVAYEGSTAPTEWTPYSNICPISGWTGAEVTVNEDVLDITFPTEAGTVYGGTLDVTSGVLTVDRAMVDLGTLNWTRRQNPNSSLSDTFLFSAPITGSGDPLFPKANFTGVLSLFKWANNYIYLTTDCSAGYIYGTQICVRYDAYTDATEFKTAVTGQTLVYELATPITYTLTPTEIRTLLGQNNVWSDAGDTTVEYRANTSAYIAKKIAEAISALS